jgi:hypothetical protein
MSTPATNPNSAVPSNRRDARRPPVDTVEASSRATFFAIK